MSVSDQMRIRLQAAFAPDRLEIVDDSDTHRGHAGWNPAGESHFRVILRAPVFAAMSRMDRHRAVHAALGAELTRRVHALALDIGG